MNNIQTLFSILSQVLWMTAALTVCLLFAVSIFHFIEFESRKAEEEKHHMSIKDFVERYYPGDDQDHMVALFAAIVRETKIEDLYRVKAIADRLLYRVVKPKKDYDLEMSIYDDSEIKAISHLPTGIDLEALMLHDGEIPDYQERTVEAKKM